MLNISIFSFNKLLPIAVFLLLGSITVALWQDHTKRDEKILLRHTETSSDQIRIRVEGLMSARIAALKLFADRWIERIPHDFSQKRFLQFAEALYTNYPGFMGIKWIDSAGVIRWVFPEENKTFIDKSVYLHADPLYQRTFENAKIYNECAATPCIEIYEGGSGFDTFRPLIVDGKVQGYLSGAFQIQLIMDICLSKDILEDFWIRVKENDKLIYFNGKNVRIKSNGKRLNMFREIHFSGKTWILELEPRNTIYTQTFFSKYLFLIFGTTISAVLTLLLFFLLHRMEMYKETRDKALHEVREREKVEDELLKNKKNLEALLSELSAKNTELETFVYSVSHDLKTPIVTIEGFIGALKEDFGDRLSEDAKTYLNYMSDATRNMENLINDLLELSRIGRVTEKKKELPFAIIVEEALNILKPQLQEKGVEVHIQKNLPVVFGNKNRYVQVMENLLTNAVKYIGQDNQTPRIEVGFQKQNNQNVFFVRDNGIGIEKRYFDKIFQVFQRLPTAKKHGQGTGIGLAIVKRIVELNGGKIWLTSEPGKGSTFFYNLWS
ncbi:MAG: ATP-binding protein [Thermodesulfobacteriota bacterium]|nr:ATP-binding protein [Thermodesulfobacteriota bacterium]